MIIARPRVPIPIRSLLLALSSAALLIFSFPGFNQPWCAWIGLVPWLILLRAVSVRGACLWSWLIGFLFFLGSLWWLVYVTTIGWIVLCAYLALYFAAFGCIVHQWEAWREATNHKRHVTRKSGCVVADGLSLVAIPSAWVALEYARSHALSGFGWNLLAYSQTSWLPVIQLADVTGVWGVSFLIVFVNAAIAKLVRGNGRRQQATKKSKLLTAYCLLLIVIVLGYGTWRLQHLPLSSSVKIAVVQGNIPQEEKWETEFAEKILQRYEWLTNTAAKTQPDLIVWPETSVPSYVPVDAEVTRRVTALAKAVKRPLLVGAPVVQLEEGGPTFSLFNSALLIDAAGQLRAQYAKLHLVPFGEFIPGERWLPWLRAILPPIGDFVPGRAWTVFQTTISNFDFRVTNVNSQFAIRNSKLPFSVLVCFEDVFPELARRFVREGARLLLVITNDAWFGPTAAAYQHTQASTFRAVELRVPVVRAANTGWSGCIDPTGRWIANVRDAQGAELFVPGTVTCALPITEEHTLYEHWGDWFAILCVIITVVGLSDVVLRTRRSTRTRPPL